MTFELWGQSLMRSEKGLWGISSLVLSLSKERNIVAHVRCLQAGLWGINMEHANGRNEDAHITIGLLYELGGVAFRR